MNDLKPCPFCGRRAKMEKKRFFGYYTYVIGCSSIKCHISPESPGYEGRAEAIAAWNRRANEAEQPDNWTPETPRDELCLMIEDYELRDRVLTIYDALQSDYANRGTEIECFRRELRSLQSVIEQVRELPRYALTREGNLITLGPEVCTEDWIRLCKERNNEWIRAADLERVIASLPPSAPNPDDPIHDKRRQDAEELQADRREALRELDDAVNGCDED